MSTQDPAAYKPHYVSVEDVPIEVADSGYDTADKRTALFGAETALELDTNGGEQIPQDELRNGHIKAVLNLGTYYLIRSATSPDDVTLGDLGDDGEQKESHAEQYLETYSKFIDKLAETGPDDQTGTYFGAQGNDAETIAVNSGECSRRHNLGEICPRETVQKVHKSMVQD